MNYPVNSLASRIGANYEATKSVGVALDTARAGVANHPGAAFGVPAPDGKVDLKSIIERSQSAGVFAQAKARPSFADSVAGPANAIGNWWSNTWHSAMTTEVAGFSIAGAMHNSVVQGAIRALEFTPEYVGNVWEARIREQRRLEREGTFGERMSFGFGTALFTGSGVDRIWNKSLDAQFEKAVESRASLFQAAWLDVADRWDQGTSTGLAADFDHMLSPEGFADREEYFSHGSAHWVTGLGDAMIQIIADPTIVGGKATAVLKSVKSTLKASDVAAMAASRNIAEEGVETLAERVALTKKQQRGSDFIHDLAVKLAGATDPERSARALQDTRWLKNSSYGATIAYAASRARTGLAGDAAVEAVETVLYAGMGHKGALARIDELASATGDEVLGVEMRRLINPGLPDGARRANDILEGPVSVPFKDATDLTSLAEANTKIVAEARKALEADPILGLEREALTLRASRDIDALRRVAEAGRTPPRAGVNTVPTDAGVLGRLPGATRWSTKSTLRAMDDNPLRVVATKNYGRFVKPVHFLTGRHIPGTLRVSDPYKAQPVIESYGVELKKMLKVDKRATEAVAAGRLPRWIDEAMAREYASAIDGLVVEFSQILPEAASKAQRAAVVNRMAHLGDEIVAARLGLRGDAKAREKLFAANEAVRGRKAADANDLEKQFQYALRDAKTIDGRKVGMVTTSDGEHVFLDLTDWEHHREFNLVSMKSIDESQIAKGANVPANAPMFASQLEDFVALIDPRALLTHATRLYANGFDGLVATARTSRFHQATQHLMHSANHLWKVAALLRIPAYTIRAMSDTVARLTVLLGGVSSLEATVEGASNLIHNSRRVTVREAAAAEHVIKNASLIRDLEDRLIPEARARVEQATEAVEAFRAAREADYERLAALDAPDPRGEAASGLVGSGDDWAQRVLDDPTRYESMVLEVGENAMLAGEQVVTRLRWLAREYDDIVEMQDLAASRRRDHDAARRELDAAAEEYDNLRFEPEDPDVPVPTAEEIAAAEKRYLAAQRGVLNTGGRVAEARDAANRGEAIARQNDIWARKADDAYSIAEEMALDAEAALALTPPHVARPTVRNQERLDALLEAYQPTPDQMARLTDTDRPLRVLVTGSQEGVDASDLSEVLETFAELGEAYGREVVVVHGGAGGVDSQAAIWARRRGLADEPHPADWEKHGNRAGYLRNQEMWDTGVDVTVAFPAGESKGVRALMETARADGGLVVDGGIPSPEMVRRALGDEKRRLVDELAEATKVTDADPGFQQRLQGYRLRRGIIEGEERAEWLRERLAADEFNREDLLRVEQARGVELHPDDAAFLAGQSSLRAELKRTLADINERYAEYEAWGDTVAPWRDKRKGPTGGERTVESETSVTGARGRGEHEAIDYSVAKDPELRRRERGEEADEFAERMRDEQVREDRTLAGLAPSDRRFDVATREANREASAAHEADYYRRRAEKIRLAQAAERAGEVDEVARQVAEIEAKRLRVQQIEERIARLEAGESTFEPLPSVQSNLREVAEANLFDAQADLRKMAERQRTAHAARQAAADEAADLASRAERLEGLALRHQRIENERAAADADVETLYRDSALTNARILAEANVEDLLARRGYLAGENSRIHRFAPIPKGRKDKKVRVGDTVLARRQGVGERVDIRRHRDLERSPDLRPGGRRISFDYRAPSASDPYRTIQEWREKLQSFDSEDAVLGMLYQGSKADVENLRRTGRWELMDPTTKPGRWKGAYLRFANFHATKDGVARRILEEWDDDMLLDWLANDNTGRAYYQSMEKAMKHRGLETSPEIVVQRAREAVDTLLPPQSEIRRTAAVNGGLTSADISRATGPGRTWAKVSDRPSVPYELIEMADRGVKASDYFADKGTKFAARYFKIFAQMPEERMGRHPLYVARYRAHYDNYMNNGALKDLDEISLEQYDAARKYADREARQDIGRYMFDTSDKSNMAHSTQLLSPFYSAWEDSMTKWYRLLGEDPGIIGKGWKIARAPNAGGLVVDEDGNRIDVYGNAIDKNTGEIIRQVGIMDGYIVVPTFGLDLTGWAGVENFRFRKDGANVVFQGDPFWLPGPGPSMAVPTNRLVRHAFPELWREREDEQTLSSTILRWILPYGPSSREGLAGDVEAAMPAWVKVAVFDTQRGSPRFDSVWTQLYQEQYTLERLGEVEKMTGDERFDLITNRTRNWFFLRLLGTQSPVSLSPESPLSHYRKEYHRFRREYGPNADEMFRQEYPDYYDMNISVSASETGLQPTVESWAPTQIYRREIAMAPEYGWFYAGAENLAGGFNQAIYSAQMVQKIDPAVGNTTFRTRLEPLDAIKRARVSEGWNEYMRVTNKINDALIAAGIPSINKKEAAEFKEIRDAFVQDLKERYPEWGDVYGAGGSSGNRAAKFLTHALKAYEENPELRERSDGEALMRYIEAREKVRQGMRAIRQARNAPGFGSLRAAEYDDLPDGTPGLRTIWEQFVSQLVDEDAGFGQMYIRALEGDDLSMGTYEGGDG